MTSPTEPDSPHRHSRWPVIGATIMLITIGLIAGLIAVGTWDPKPYGVQLARIHPGERSTHQEEVIEWLALPTLSGTLPPTTTLRLEAAYAAGELDSGYGLVYGDSSSAIVVAVSPLGYASLWESGRPGEPYIHHLPWQPWPHVDQGTTTNELWLDAAPADDRTLINVRINRELFWSGTVPTSQDAQPGLWLGTFGEQTTASFETLTLFGTE